MEDRTMDERSVPFAITPMPIAMMTAEIEASRGSEVDEATEDYIIEEVAKAIDERIVTE